MSDRMEWLPIAAEFAKCNSWAETLSSLYSDMNNSDWDLPITKEGLRSAVRRYCKQNNIQLRPTTADLGQKQPQESYELKPDGTVISEKLLKIANLSVLSVQSLLEAHGFDDNWEIISYKNNLWNALAPEGRQITQYQSKITVKPRTNSVSFKHIDDYFDNKEYKPAREFSLPSQYSEDGEILEIDMPDLHNGLLSWRKETDEDYDLHIARQRFMRCIMDIVGRCKWRTFKKIVFVTLGDLMHIDNDEQKTTKGTFQQADGRTAKIFDYTLNILIDAITMLAEIAPVEMIYVCGNHDKTMGYTLARAVQMAFRTDDSIEFDVTPNPQKGRLWGGNLVGFTHGDMAKTNMRGWLQQRFKKEFGQSKHVEIHAGHYHSEKTTEIKQTTDDQGIIVRHLPAICGASYWEHQQGYGSGESAVVSFVWNDDLGLREMWHSTI